MRLKEQVIRTTEPPARGYKLIRDGEVPGFALRVTANGFRAFVLTYTVDSRQRRLTIGSWPTWSCAAARERAKALRRLVDMGEDPLGKREQRRAAPTFADVAAEYIKHHAAGKKSGARDEQVLRNAVLPHWGTLKAQDIGRPDAWELLQRTKETSGPVAANRLLSLLRKVFNFAIFDERAEACRLKEPNPLHRMQAPGGQEKPRTRVLDEGEIRRFWTALDGKSAMGPATCAVLKMVLLTAQRPGECASMEWAELDEGFEWWTLPESRTKAGRLHRVPITGLAREILLAQPRTGRRYVFSVRSGKPITVQALSNGLRTAEHFGLPHFGPHDLRRTSSDWMARLGVDGRSRAAVLNHREIGVTARHYTQYLYDKEKLSALSRWERKLRGILEGVPGEKVVSIS